MSADPTTTTLLARAGDLDAADPLAPFLERFTPPPPGVVYLDGNSLGQPPRATAQALADVVAHAWGERLIRSWDEGWMELPAQIGDALAGGLLGAAAGQTLLADSTTVCFYKLAAAALHARPGRRTIITDTANFPTDRYVLEGLATRHDRTIAWLEPDDPAGGPEPERVEKALHEHPGDVALVTFSHVDYRSAHIADLASITELAHRAGALVLWDLSHSAGAMAVELDAHGVDLAVGCTYKYLNGGPGAPAYLYVNARHHDALAQPIQGWLGRADPFAMAPGYVPAPGLGHMLSGTPPVLGLTAARVGIELSAAAGVGPLRAKSTQLTEYAVALADALLAPRGAALGSPRDPARRGGHVSIIHPDARGISRALIDEGVIVDFRAPDVIRLGLSPLTTRFADVRDGLSTIAKRLERSAQAEG